MTSIIFLGEFGGDTEVIIVLFLLILPYFIPTFIAFSKGRRNKVAIFILNLLLGWTLLGWIICIVWACISDREPQNIIINNSALSDNKPVTEISNEDMPTNSSKYDEKLENLKQLKELLDSGILTEEEFNVEKKKILS